jgi:hypothetical protein
LLDPLSLTHFLDEENLGGGGGWVVGGGWWVWWVVVVGGVERRRRTRERESGEKRVVKTKPSTANRSNSIRESE